MKQVVGVLSARDRSPAASECCAISSQGGASAGIGLDRRAGSRGGDPGRRLWRNRQRAKAEAFFDALLLPTQYDLGECIWRLSRASALCVDRFAKFASAVPGASAAEAASAPSFGWAGRAPAPPASERCQGRRCRSAEDLVRLALRSRPKWLVGQ